MKKSRVNAKYATVPFIPVVMVTDGGWGWTPNINGYSHLFEPGYYLATFILCKMKNNIFKNAFYQTQILDQS